MARTRISPIRKRRKKKIMKAAKGFRGTRSRNFRKAKEAVYHSMEYAYRDRKNKKRDFRRLWITRINAAVRNRGLSYSNFICGLKNAKVNINRKLLSEMAIANEKAFTQLVEIAKKNLK